MVVGSILSRCPFGKLRPLNLQNLHTQSPVPQTPAAPAWPSGLETQLMLRCQEGPGFNPQGRDLGTTPARVQGEQPEVDRSKTPLWRLAAAGVFFVVVVR